MNRIFLLIAYIALLLVLSSSATALICLQQFANESSACGGVAGDNYFVEGTTTPAINSREAGTDNDWGTYATPANSEASYVFINYTKPTGGRNSSKLELMYGWGPGNRSNFTIPTNCWEQGDKLEFQLEVNKECGVSNCAYGNLTCWNGTGWYEISNQRTDQGGGAQWVEEWMWWNITVDETTLNITYPTTENSISVSEGTNFSINLTFLIDESEVTSGLSIENITIDGNVTDIVNTPFCTGTLNCGAYSTESSCNNCSQCNWVSGSSIVTEIDFENFDADFGDWQQATFDTDDWLRKTGAPSDSSGTGPESLYDGPYAVVETSNGYCNNPDTAVLYLSPPIDFDNYDFVNISLAYNMYGSTMGTLNIKENSTGSWNTIWSLSGNQGVDWFELNVNISYPTGIGSVAIWMDCGNSYQSDAAVDFINVTGTTLAGCLNSGSCSSCVLDECNTNCSDGGCSIGNTPQFDYVVDRWELNVTAPFGSVGLVDLFINASYSSYFANETEIESINYVSGDVTPPYVSIAPTNISTTNETILWNVTFNEASNMSGTYGVCPEYTTTAFSNSTYATTLKNYQIDLTNSTTYCYNITSFCDSSGNCNESNYLFNFTTIETIVQTGCFPTLPLRKDHTFQCDDSCVLNDNIITTHNIYFNGSGNPSTTYINATIKSLLSDNIIAVIGQNCTVRWIS